MADKIQLLLEGEKRGILNDQQKGLLAEARKRGMVGKIDAVTPVEPGKYTPEQQAAAQEYIKQMRTPTNPGLVAWAQGALQNYGDEIGGAVRSAFGPGTYNAERDRARQVIGA